MALKAFIKPSEAPERSVKKMNFFEYNFLKCTAREGLIFAVNPDKYSKFLILYDISFHNTEPWFGVFLSFNSLLIEGIFEFSSRSQI